MSSMQLLQGYQMHIKQFEVLLQTKQQKHSQLAGDCLSALVNLLRGWIMDPAMHLYEAARLWQVWMVQTGQL